MAAEWYCRAALKGVDGYSIDDKSGEQLKKHISGTFYATFDRGYISAREYSKGHVHDEEFLKTLSLYLAAARQEGAREALEIAERYTSGRDAPQDEAKAWRWSSIAGDRGLKVASQKAAELERSFSPEELKNLREDLVSLRRQLDSVATEVGPGPIRGKR
jgi:TPR repeat protein